MSSKHWMFLLIAFAAITVPATSSPAANEQTVGLFLNEEGAMEGYTLFAPVSFETTYLIDNDGLLVHSWDSEYRPSLSGYLLENGNLLRGAKLAFDPAFGVGGGRVEELAWDGTVVWEFEYRTDQFVLHHDIEPLPNGNVLMIAWEKKTAAEAIAAGRNLALLRDGELWPDHIIEVRPTGASGGDIVWEWHLWDHLVQDIAPAMDNFGVVADHPELVDLNFMQAPGADWNHTNGIDYNEELDQILISPRHFSEFWVIDHSTTTEEAASHTGGNSGKGGDLLYRWGNPRVYDAGDAGDRTLFFPHNPQWIEAGLPGEGNILVFSNGPRPGGEISSVDEIVPPVDGDGNYSLTPGEAYGPATAIWTYMADEPLDFYSEFISGAQRLANGNTLIDEGMNGNFFEVTAAGDVVWRYVNPVAAVGPLAQGDPIPFPDNRVFKVFRYSADDAGLDGQDLSPQGPVELPKEPPTPPATAAPTVTPMANGALAATATATPTLPGDVNGDGFVDSLDALLILQFDAGLLAVLPNLSAADVDEDGTVDSLDAALVLQLTAGLLDFL